MVTVGLLIITTLLISSCSDPVCILDSSSQASEAGVLYCRTLMCTAFGDSEYTEEQYSEMMTACTEMYADDHDCVPKDNCVMEECLDTLDYSKSGCDDRLEECFTEAISCDDTRTGKETGGTGETSSMKPTIQQFIERSSILRESLERETRETNTNHRAQSSAQTQPNHLPDPPAWTASAQFDETTREAQNAPHGEETALGSPE